MKKIISHIQIIVFAFVGILLIHCRGDEYIPYEETEQPSEPEYTLIKGFYLLNEGVMGSNKATLDFYDYETATYRRNIYSTINPNVVKELGDVGNDIKIYGSKMYAIINVSNKIEVMDAKTSKRITSIPLENGRYLAFHNGKVYASSYAGPVSLDPKAPLGKVVEIDTISFKIQREATVGYQPEQMQIVNNQLYVANSGGYRVPNYDNTISVVDLATFKEEKKIEVGINLHRMEQDARGNLYVSSRGNYYDIPSTLYLVDTKNNSVKKNFQVAVNGMTIVKDKLYFYGNEFNYNTTNSKKIFGIIDTQTEQIISTEMIEKSYQDKIKTPYGIAVNTISGDIYITDAGNYVSTGYLYAFDKNGKFKWRTEAGNIPAHLAFLYR